MALPRPRVLKRARSLGVDTLEIRDATLTERRELVEWIGQHWSGHPTVRAWAGDILRAENATTDPLAYARALWRWGRRNVRYAREVGEIVELPGYVWRHRVTDCDGWTAFVLALGAALGMPGRACVAWRVEEKEGSRACIPFHMFPILWVAHDPTGRDGTWVPVDFTPGVGELQHPADLMRVA